VLDAAAAAAAGEIILPAELAENPGYRAHKVPAAAVKGEMVALGAPEEEETFVGNPTRHRVTVCLEMLDYRDWSVRAMRPDIIHHHHYLLITSHIVSQ